MKRFDRISIFGCKLVSDQLTWEESGPYICDRSHFTPVSELAKSVVGQSIGKTDLSRYDFADGRDTGIDVPLARRRPELAEMSVDVRYQQNKVRSSLEKAAKKKAAMDEFRRIANGGDKVETKTE